MDIIDLNNHPFGEVPNTSNLSEYPTILDVLDSVTIQR